MSEFDDIKRALEELSSHPPHRDRKPGVNGRIAAARRRRQVASGTTLSLLTLLTAIAFTALPSDTRQPDTAVTSQSQQTPTPLVAPQPPAPSSETRPAVPTAAAVTAETIRPSGENVPPTVVTPARPSASASRTNPTAPVTPPRTGAAGPTTTGTPTASALPSASVAASAPASSPQPPISSSKPPASATATPTGSASPSSAVPGSPSASSDELLAAEIEAVTDPGGDAPETTVKVRVHGRIRGSIDAITVWFTKLHHASQTATQARACTARDEQLHDVDETFTFRTRYRAAGKEQIDASITTLDHTCARTETPQVWPVSAEVNIPVGSSLSNGVEPVELTLGAPAVQGSRVTIYAGASDLDGYVSGFVVSWGVGTPESYPGGNGANCSANEYGGTFWPQLNGSGNFTSPELPPGTHTVTITATSNGCDGKATQTDQKTVTVTVP